MKTSHKPEKPTCSPIFVPMEKSSERKPHHVFLSLTLQPQSLKLNRCCYPDQPYLGASSTTISCSTPNSPALLTFRTIPLATAMHYTLHSSEITPAFSTSYVEMFPLSPISIKIETNKFENVNREDRAVQTPEPPLYQHQEVHKK